MPQGRHFNSMTLLMFVALLCASISWSTANFPKPNIVVLMADDLGYGDLAVYGSPVQRWNEVDQLMSEGNRFTNAYAADSMCSPSRAGFMTGRLPIRLGVTGGRRVFIPSSTGGLPEDEVTIAQMMKGAGYVTGMTGKWHLGINAFNQTDGTHLPSRKGFDYVGINLPFTNVWHCDETGTFYKNVSDSQRWKRCFIYRGDKIVQQPIKFGNLTNQLYASWKEFLNMTTSEPKRPFFFYFSFPHVHSMQFASEKFAGNSPRGLYGDNIAEMAWAVGKVKEDIRKFHNNNTLIIFMSDHGPHRELCNYGGSTAGLKGGKSNSYEGGFRIPFAAWWPEHIKGNQVSNAVVSSLDLFPTFRYLAYGYDFFTDRRNYVKYFSHDLDGVNIWNQLVDRTLESELTDLRPIFYYCNANLMAVRNGFYKVHYMTSPIFNNGSELKLKENCPEGFPNADWYVSQTCPDADLIKLDPPEVYNLERDPYELYPLDATSARTKEILRTFSEFVRTHKSTIAFVESQLEDSNDGVIPCCDPPDCNCDYLTVKVKVKESSWWG